MDVAIVGARVLDGSGNPWTFLNVGLRADRIAWLGRPGEPLPAAATTIDAQGLYLCPGFIDLHTHNARALADPKLSHLLNFLKQGVTTVVVGNDGGSPWPVGDTLKLYESNGMGPNVALLVGHGTVRRQVLGASDRRPTPEELERMRSMVERAMKEGAYGISTGLYYAPGSYSDTGEVIALAREAARWRGFYDSHIRDESDYTVGLLSAVEELIRIGEEGGLPVHVSHIKALGAPVWGLSEAVIERVEEARARGVDITADQYPYLASSTSVTGALMPRWALAGGRAATAKRLSDPPQRMRILEEVKANIERRGGPVKLVVSFAGDTKLQGLSLHDIAASWGSEPSEVALKLLESGGAGLISFNMRSDDLRAFMTRSWVATGSDGVSVAFGEGRPHPRGYGTFPRKISRYVRQKRWIDLPFAVRAATSLPAAIAGLRERGRIQVGSFADLVVFDVEKLRDPADFDSPHQYAEGVRFLFINGVAAIEDGSYTGRRPGRALRKSQPLN